MGLSTDRAIKTFQSKGYHSTCLTQVSYRGKVLPHTSSLSVLEGLHTKNFVHPVIGNIKIVAQSILPEEEAALPQLLDQLEGILVSDKQVFTSFSGQRSPLYALEQPFHLGPRLFDGLQFKGFLYRKLGQSEVSYPIMQEYHGIGCVDSSRDISPAGTISILPPTPRPYAAMLLEQAKNEFVQTAHLFSEFDFIAPPLAFGEFKDMVFNVKGQPPCKVGFMIHFTEGIQRQRTWKYMEQILAHKKNDAKITEIVEQIFTAAGVMLSMFHAKGLAHGYFHLENLSFDPLSPFSASQMRCHDFDNITNLRDFTLEAFFAMTLLDIMELLYAPTRAEDFVAQQPSIWLNLEAVKRAQPHLRFLDGYLGSFKAATGIPEKHISEMAHYSYFLLSNYLLTYPNPSQALVLDSGPLKILPRAVMAKLGNGILV